MPDSKKISERLGIVETKIDLMMGSMQNLAAEQKDIVKLLSRNTVVANIGIFLGSVGFTSIIGVCITYFVKAL